MIAFDTDVFSELLRGNTHLVQRVAALPTDQLAVPVIVAEELLRGRLNVIRQAEAGRAKVSIERAYWLFEQTIKDLSQLRILSYSEEAHRVYHQWRQQKIRLATRDLRIAAICVSRNVKLISRNRRDFQRVPNLTVEFWD